MFVDSSACRMMPLALPRQGALPSRACLISSPDPLTLTTIHVPVPPCTHLVDEDRGGTMFNDRDFFLRL